MIIEWIPGLSFPDWADIVQTAADAALLTEGITETCSVTVWLTDNPGIRQINKKTRSVDKATDVLSFPVLHLHPKATLKHSRSRMRAAYDDHLNAVMLGDMVMSAPMVNRQAAAFKRPIARELAYMTVHAVFHLMGYDHHTREDKREMRAMEEKALNRIGLGESGGPSDEELLALARSAMRRAYTPYSHFNVGAALKCADGRVYLGCNIENASYGLTNCAERTAVFKAVSDGATDFTVIAVAADAEAWPCGACRQVLNEFAPRIRVLVTWGDNHVNEAPLSELLPHSFSSGSLMDASEGLNNG